MTPRREGLQKCPIAYCILVVEITCYFMVGAVCWDCPRPYLNDWQDDYCTCMADTGETSVVLLNCMLSGECCWYNRSVATYSEFTKLTRDKIYVFNCWGLIWLCVASCLLCSCRCKLCTRQVSYRATAYSQLVLYRRTCVTGSWLWERSCTSTWV